jgi:glycine dehydrogenase
MLSDKIENRHNGPRESEIARMLESVGVNSLDDLIDKAVPASSGLRIVETSRSMTEFEYLNHIRHRIKE